MGGAGTESRPGQQPIAAGVAPPAPPDSRPTLAPAQQEQQARTENHKARDQPDKLQRGGAGRDGCRPELRHLNHWTLSLRQLGAQELILAPVGLGSRSLARAPGTGHDQLRAQSCRLHGSSKPELDQRQDRPGTAQSSSQRQAERLRRYGHPCLADPNRNPQQASSPQLCRKGSRSAAQTDLGRRDQLTLTVGSLHRIHAFPSAMPAII